MESYFDLHTALEYVGGYWHIFKGLQKKFISEYKNYDKALVKTFRKGNTDETHKMIHSLKGISMNLGAVELFNASILAEENLYRKSDNPLSDYLKVFSKTYDEIKSFKK